MTLKLRLQFSFYGQKKGGALHFALCGTHTVVAHDQRPFWVVTSDQIYHCYKFGHINTKYMYNFWGLDTCTATWAGELRTLTEWHRCISLFDRREAGDQKAIER